MDDRINDDRIGDEVDQKSIAGILLSGLDPVSKVQRLMDMGFEEETANEIVDRYQIGQGAPVLYERLDYDQHER